MSPGGIVPMKAKAKVTALAIAMGLLMLGCNIPPAESTVAITDVKTLIQTVYLEDDVRCYIAGASASISCIVVKP